MNTKNKLPFKVKKLLIFNMKFPGEMPSQNLADPNTGSLPAEILFFVSSNPCLHKFCPYL
jgi:hypothetical protein